MNLMLHILRVTALIVEVIELVSKIFQGSFISPSDIDSCIVVLSLFVSIQKSRVSPSQPNQNLIALIYDRYNPKMLQHFVLRVTASAKDQVVK